MCFVCAPHVFYLARSVSAYKRVLSILSISPKIVWKAPNYVLILLLFYLLS